MGALIDFPRRRPPSAFPEDAAWRIIANAVDTAIRVPGLTPDALEPLHAMQIAAWQAAGGRTAV